jgi:hypothetical protein
MDGPMSEEHTTPLARWRPYVSWRAVLAGFVLGSIISWTAGIWVAFGLQRDLAADLAQQRQQLDAEVERQRILTQDLGNLRERIASIEARLGNYVANAEELRTIDRHLSAVDGRQDGIDHRMQALEEQVTNARGKVDAALAASGRKR